MYYENDKAFYEAITVMLLLKGEKKLANMDLEYKSQIETLNGDLEVAKAAMAALEVKRDITKSSYILCQKLYCSQILFFIIFVLAQTV